MVPHPVVWLRRGDHRDLLQDRIIPEPTKCANEPEILRERPCAILVHNQS